jgi:integrase
MKKGFGIGGIYSDQKCGGCGKSFVDDGQVSLRCPDHPYSMATSFKVKIRGTTARFSGYFKAKDHLYAMRKAIDSGYWSGVVDQKTLGHVQDKFLDWKRDLVKMGRLNTSSVNAYRNRLNRIVHVIGVGKDASSIRYRHVHEFLYKAGFSPKSTHDSYTVFKEMIEWAFDMGDLAAKPKWPSFSFSFEHDMKLRKTITKEEQEKVLDAVYHCEWSHQPRLYVAIKFLCTYINVRPGELLGANEEDLNRQEGILVIAKHKNGGLPKHIRLLQEDVDLLNSLPTGMPGMPLFRHDRPVQRVKVGQRFGEAAFSRAWKRACKVVGIEGVDLYGGTRHSSAIALYQDSGLSPEQVKKATGHKSSSSFERYFRMDIDDVAELHAKAAPTRREVI